MNNSKHIKDVLNQGFTIIRNVISEKECNNIKKICKEKFVKYSKIT